MKVLKKNNKIKCEFCKSKLHYETEDICEKEIGCEHITYIVCPVCKGKIRLSDTIIGG